MDLILTGGSPLQGEVQVRGAKNSVSKLMVAALLSEESSILRWVPEIKDVEVVTNMITLLGGQVEYLDPHTIRIDPKGLHTVIEYSALKAIDNKSRIPILFAGPLLSRLGEAFIPELGGDDIGPRPTDFHVSALEQMGAIVERIENGYHMRASRLQGTKIRLSYPSVGATEQVLLAAVLANGITELSNAAIEPEIIDLVCVLQKMGAIISVDADRSITIIGVDSLRGFDHTPIPDRLEAASWACAAAITNGEIFVRGARQTELMTFLNKFRQAGGLFEIKEDGIKFKRGQELRSVILETNVYPGFATDWHQPFTVLLTQANGVSVVHETVYENRFEYTNALNSMGAKIQLHKECLGSLTCRFGRMNHYHSATILGPTALTPAEIVVPDLRAGFAYVIAALVAEGTSTIKNANLISRGYENFVGKLKSLGVETVEK